MKYDDLPERWKNKVSEFLQNSGVYERDRFNASDFLLNQVLSLKFDDESQIEFRNFLLINAPEINEIGVFTEHCGQHIFNLEGTYVSLNCI